MIALPDFLTSFAEFGFLTRALVAGLLLALACGLLSPFVVLRRLSFSADGLAHASLGGLAAGLFLLDSGPVPSLASYGLSFLFTCGVAAGIAWLNQGGRVSADTAVGACYVAAFALGVLLLSWRQRYTSHLEHFFFGSILAVDPLECVLLAGLALGVLGFLLLHWRHLAQWTLDEELAQANGVRVRALRCAMLLLLAATVVLSVKVVGLLLVTAMLILPGAIGSLAARTLLSVAGCSVASALASAGSGMVLSNVADVPPGPATVLILFALFVAAFLGRQHSDQRRARAGTFPVTPFSTTSTLGIMTTDQQQAGPKSGAMLFPNQ
jgi:zinc transport system permease protein